MAAGNGDKKPEGRPGQKGSGNEHDNGHKGDQKDGDKK